MLLIAVSIFNTRNARCTFAFSLTDLIIFLRKSSFDKSMCYDTSAAVIWDLHKSVGKKRKGMGAPSISERKLPRLAFFCLLISCPPECAPIVNFAFVSFVNLYRPLLLPIELFHYHRHRLKPQNSLENSCRPKST